MEERRGGPSGKEKGGGHLRFGICLFSSMPCETRLFFFHPELHVSQDVRVMFPFVLIGATARSVEKDGNLQKTSQQKQQIANHHKPPYPIQPTSPPSSNPR